MSSEEEVRDTIEKFFRAMDTQDLELMDSLLPREPSMVHIGTDAGEIWRGYEQLYEDTIAQFERLESYRADIRELTVNFSATEDTAWYFHLLDARIVSGGEVTEWEGARFTGVLEKRGGSWKMMQTHVSVPGER